MPRVIAFEISTDQPARAARFYAAAFGWRMERGRGAQDAVTLCAGAGIEGSIVPARFLRATVVPIVRVTSVDDTLALVIEAGGKILHPSMHVTGIGYVAYILDSEGNPIGLRSSDRDPGEGRVG